MIIAEVISERDANVFSILPTATLERASAMLARNRVGALVVTDRWGKLIGILSERDVVRLIGEYGAAAMVQTVESVMTRRVETCTPLDDVCEVVMRMNRLGFRHMPVVEGDQLLTVISVRDLARVLVDSRAHRAGITPEWMPWRRRRPAMVAR